MSRTTRTDLVRLARLTSEVIGEEYSVQYAYGQPRLFRLGESVEVSPRLPPGELEQWMRAYLAGAGRMITLRIAQIDRDLAAVDADAEEVVRQAIARSGR